MFKLESDKLKREFRINEGNFYASQIYNKSSKMSFVPDGNGAEFYIRLMNGYEFSSKGLQVTNSRERNGSLEFTFEEVCGIEVTIKYWIHKDNSTVCKQIILNQTGDEVIDYVALENVGIINSKTYFSVDTMDDAEITGSFASLGQPFYIDSLFFGCEFPVTENRISHGRGTIKYYLGKSVGANFECPVTVMGAANSNMLRDVQDAFFEYIDVISQKSDLRLQFNSWYDYMLNIDADNIEKSFFDNEKNLTKNGVAPLDAYVVDDGWNEYKNDFWSFNQKFPNGMSEATELAKKLSSNFGLWLGPRGGYNYNRAFAKRIQKGGNGYYNAEADDICVASHVYIEYLTKFLCDATKDFDIDYWKWDGFCKTECQNSKHDHMVGGENNMYFITDMWNHYIKLFEKVREVRKQQGKDLWINMTCYVNVSPWWLQWVNSIWIQNSTDIGFADNLNNQPQVESEITYRDGRYFDCFCTRAHQFPLKNIYNHEPIYGTNAKVNYTDEEFEKYVYWCITRGNALGDIHLTASMMNDNKWLSLSKAINWQRKYYYILKHATYIGGDPTDNNIYGFVSWTKEGEGVIALRNPSDESCDLTLTLNKLMGVPETLKDVHRHNIYNKSMPEVLDTYSYNDKIDLTLKPFEVMIFQFSNDYVDTYENDITDFSIEFDSSIQNGVICENNDVKLQINDGIVEFTVGDFTLTSKEKATDGKVVAVREKNKMMKLYLNHYLDSSLYDKDMPAKVDIKFDNDVKVTDRAIGYDEIVVLKQAYKNSKKRKKNR